MLAEKSPLDIQIAVFERTGLKLSGKGRRRIPRRKLWRVPMKMALLLLCVTSVSCSLFGQEMDPTLAWMTLA